MVNPLNGPSALTGSKAAEVGDLVAYGERMTAIPDSCRVLLEPVAASDGVEQASVTSATGPMDPFIAVSAYLPVSVPVAIPDGGCEQFDYEVEGAIPDGTVRRLTAPVIDGAQTYALRTAITVDGVPIAGALVEYFYVAILDGRTFVKIWARVPNEFEAEPALGKLLTRTVSALADA
ncbi:hypothetical protein GCM10023114_27450 [Mycolicibacterium sediminis]|uniref:DUF5642 domain-containing protein n=1 Tax=Mycolicibacterium sediminis TaxID=1286180 RepID=A0A7I7QIR2_9MYCO|nr:hypothetical protein MSEDJ_01060 [Mycolicibacterium sediminis]